MRIQFVDHEFMADLKVYVVDHEFMADTKAFVVHNDFEGGVKAYRVEHEFMADLKVYLVAFEFLAGSGGSSYGGGYAGGYTSVKKPRTTASVFSDAFTALFGGAVIALGVAIAGSVVCNNVNKAAGADPFNGGPYDPLRLFTHSAAANGLVVAAVLVASIIGQLVAKARGGIWSQRYWFVSRMLATASGASAWLYLAWTRGRVERGSLGEVYPKDELLAQWPMAVAAAVATSAALSVFAVARAADTATS